MKPTLEKRDIHQEITDKIILMLEDLPEDGFEAPFASLAAQGLPINAVTKDPYQGINVPSLWIDQQIKQYTSTHWATFKQWQSIGANVRRGEKASIIVFYKSLKVREETPDGESELKNIPMLRHFTVFNADQVDGYDNAEANTTKPHDDLVTRIERAEQFCKHTGADIRTGGQGAYFSPAGDYVNMPQSCAFHDTAKATATEGYYSVLFHELTHWTGGSKRLDRTQKGFEQSRTDYAFEELIAELGSAFLCSHLNITQSVREDHAHYIKSWLKALKNDKKFIFRAAADASRATEFLIKSQPAALTEDLAA